MYTRILGILGFNRRWTATAGATDDNAFDIPSEILAKICAHCLLRVKEIYDARDVRMKCA